MEASQMPTEIKKQISSPTWFHDSLNTQMNNETLMLQIPKNRTPGSPFQQNLQSAIDHFSTNEKDKGRISLETSSQDNVLSLQTYIKSTE